MRAMLVTMSTLALLLFFTAAPTGSTALRRALRQLDIQALVDQALARAGAQGTLSSWQAQLQAQAQQQAWPPQQQPSLDVPSLTINPVNIDVDASKQATDHRQQTDQAQQQQQQQAAQPQQGAWPAQQMGQNPQEQQQQAQPQPVPFVSTGGDDILALHNSYRSRHATAPLVWASDLESSAQVYAKALAAACAFQHSNQGGVGENLAAGHSAWSNVAADWYNEISQYDFSRPGYSHSTGHVTQMLWASTSEVGCAFASAGGSSCWYRTVWACRYRAPGNVNSANQFRANVRPMSSSK